MRKGEKPANKPVPLEKEPESMGAPLRIKRVRKMIRGQPAGFFSDSEDEKPPKGPTIASLSTSNRSTRANVERAHNRIAETNLSIKGLRDVLDEIRRGFSQQLHRIARAVGVAHVLNEQI